MLLDLLVFRNTGSRYSKLLLIALTFCLAGDIFLLNDKYFLFGLASFLVAHVFFSLAFLSINGFKFHITPLVVLSLVLGSYYVFLFDHLHEFAVPAGIYLVMILVMNWLAIAVFINEKRRIYFLLAAAAILFTVSDAMIAYNKFVGVFRCAEVLILSTYWIAIYVFVVVGAQVEV